MKIKKGFRVSEVEIDSPQLQTDTPLPGDFSLFNQPGRSSSSKMIGVPSRPNWDMELDETRVSYLGFRWRSSIRGLIRGGGVVGDAVLKT